MPESSFVLLDYPTSGSLSQSSPMFPTPLHLPSAVHEAKSRATTSTIDNLEDVQKEENQSAVATSATLWSIPALVLGEVIGEDDGDEIVVYVASHRSHPRNGKLVSAHNPIFSRRKNAPSYAGPSENRVKRRRGGSTLLVAEVEDSEEDDNGDMLVDQVIEADAVTAAPRSLVLAFCDRDPLHAIGQLQPSVNLSAIAVTRTLVLFFVFIRAPQAVPRVVLQVTRTGMRLPDDVPCFESLCSRTVGWPVKDMIREELDQEQDFNDDLDLDSDSDVDNEDSIIARIQYFLGENDDTLRAKDRKQRNRIFRAIHNGKFEVVLNNFIDSSPSTYPTPLSTANRSRRRPIRAHDEARQQGAKQPDRRWRSSASSWSSDTSGASVEDLRSAPTLSLLPMARYAAKSVRELLRAFGLKSMSEGNGEARFTKLFKTMLSDIRADERNVVRILVKPPHGRGAWEREEKGGENEDHPQDG
ncbi:hypothetical protein EDB89DRAFT_2228354 [Lactarius sanguifluus]|nr:hypothetical protein EDB89DRAFT_2228354 [Lactarius sanguifluus]